MITGAGGMLGTTICNELKDVEMHAFKSRELDIICVQQLSKTIARLKPDYIINCAAYTAVDLAESNPEIAHRINHHAVEKLAELAAQHNATLIHFSTDYVFDGTAKTPYLPQDSTNPINVYGKSKLLGERAIERSGTNYYIFRLSWLYAPHGKNFFRWVMENDQDEMKVVDNQIGSPTSALDVAQFINHVVHHDPKNYGSYHFTNVGSMSWFAFAKAILDKTSSSKKLSPTNHFKTAAVRPNYSVMDTTSTAVTFQYTINSTRTALDHVLRSYNRDV